MSTYAFRDAGGDLILSAPEFGRPIPAHAQTPEAEAARAAHRAVALSTRRRTVDPDADIVIDHGRPPVVPYDGVIVPTNARKLAALAERAGLATKILELADRCTVEGLDLAAGVGFRATYVRGRASSGTWHERPRFVMMRDDRPLGLNKVTRTGKKGFRQPGMSELRLKCVASPSGLPCNVTEIEARLKERISDGD